MQQWNQRREGDRTPPHTMRRLDPAARSPSTLRRRKLRRARRRLATVLRLWVPYGDSYTRISGAIVEIPPSFERRETFDERRTLRILAGSLVTLCGTDERRVRPRNQLQRIAGVKQRLAARVHACRQCRIAVRLVIPRIVEHNDAVRGEQRGRTRFDQPGIEIARPRRQHLDEPAARVFQRGPVDQVIGRRQPQIGDAEVHPVLPIHPGRDDAITLDSAENGARFGFEAQILAAGGLSKRRSVFRPDDQVARGRYGQPRHVPIPLRVRQHVRAVMRLNDAGILDTPRPLILPLCIGVGIQHGSRTPREVQTVAALGEAESRRVAADLALAAGILGAIEEKDSPVSHDRRRIERRVFLPRHYTVVDRGAETSGWVRRDDGVYVHRFGEGAEHPRLLGWRGSHAYQREQVANDSQGPRPIGTGALRVDTPFSSKLSIATQYDCPTVSARSSSVVP